MSNSKLFCVLGIILGCDRTEFLRPAVGQEGTLLSGERRTRGSQG